MNKALFWSNPKIKTNNPRNLPYIIHQTFMYGSLEDITQLKKEFGLKKLQKIFIEQPINTYTKPAFQFIKKFVLKLEKEDLNEKDYIKTFSASLTKKTI